MIEPKGNVLQHLGNNMLCSAVQRQRHLACRATTLQRNEPWLHKMLAIHAKASAPL